VNPKDEERFSLRTLLLYKKGATSFKDIKTVNDKTYLNFKDTCQALGFLDDDNELDKCLSEAASYQTYPGAMRELFANILTNCLPTNCRTLWDKHKFSLADDLLQKIRHTRNDYELPCSQRILDLTLHLINVQLKKTGQSITDFDLPTYDIPNELYSRLVLNNIVLDELSYDKTELQDEINKNLHLLNTDQRRIYDLILDNIEISKNGKHKKK